MVSCAWPGILKCGENLKFPGKTAEEDKSSSDEARLSQQTTGGRHLRRARHREKSQRKLSLHQHGLWLKISKRQLGMLVTSECSVQLPR